MGFIGVIDSGVGGLTILRQLVDAYSYDFVYVADHAFCPYGTKSNDMVYSRASKLVGFLKDKGAQAVVLACNTMSCFADRLQQIYELPIFDVITPTCNRLVNSGVHNVALLATRSTIANGAYQANLQRRGITVTPFDCSAFVPYVEQNATTTIAFQSTIHNVLRDLPQMQADAVILGCTHFPLLRRQIAYYCPYSQIVECSCDLPSGIADAFGANKNVAYFTTGDVDFANLAASWCKDKRVSFQHLSLI